MPESQIQQYLVQLRQRENEDMEVTNTTDLIDTLVGSEDIQEQFTPPSFECYSTQWLTLKIRDCLILGIMYLVEVRIVFSQVPRAL